MTEKNRKWNTNPDNLKRRREIGKKANQKRWKEGRAWGQQPENYERMRIKDNINSRIRNMKRIIERDEELLKGMLSGN